MLEIVRPDIAGDPETGKCWLRRSLSKVQRALAKIGYRLSRGTIRRLLRQQGIRPKSNRKRLKTNPNPQRDTQFRYLQRQREAFEALKQPIISVDTKKRELIGNFVQAGQVWCAQATAVNMHDFASEAIGKAIPHGIYDPQYNDGYMCVGQSADTAEFAVDNLVEWWLNVGCHRYPEATDILILVDGGGSNSYRARRWKQQLQLKLADLCGLTVTVAHYPPGASKWNPIEHRLFSQVSQTWAGTPLTSFERLLDGIRQTITTTGLTVQAVMVEDAYQTGIKVSDTDMAALNIEQHTICPQWNYTISPRKTGGCF